ncbi:MAG: PaaI family thioesterase [Mycobacteriaceae bacterium]|nr:PaaI family thioesterase [Mycobacteriaceae bacterium]
MTVDDGSDLIIAGFQKLGFIQFTGIEGVETGNGRSVISMTPKPEHLNHNGDVHAALLFGMGETAAMGAAVSGLWDLMAESFVVTSGGRIEYLARAKGAAGPYTATSDIPPADYAAARTAAEQGASLELEVPFTVADADGREVSRGGFVAIIRPRRK